MIGIGKENRRIRGLTFGALTAALYAVFTLMSAIFGMSGGAVQLRLSEALCILPAIVPPPLAPFAAAGLTVGCVLSDIITGCAVLDIVFGSLATLIGALGAIILRRTPRLSWIPAVLMNTLILPQIFIRVYGAEEALWFLTLTVGVGELLSCGVLGLVLMPVMKRVLAVYKE